MCYSTLRYRYSYRSRCQLDQNHLSMCIRHPFWIDVVPQEAEVAPIIADYWERAEFPHHLVPKLAKLNLSGATLQGNGCPGQSILAAVSMPTTRPARECITLVTAPNLRAGYRSLDVSVHVQPSKDTARFCDTYNQGPECSTLAAEMWRDEGSVDSLCARQ